MRRTPWIAVRIIMLAVCAHLLAGCAQNPPGEEVYDPLEPFNRHVYAFNETVDKYALGPASRAYTRVTPNAFRRGVTNFFDNVAYPGVVLNDLLQGKVEIATRDTVRFLFNSTLGLGGFFDPASSLGLQSHNEDFGQTLGTWGSGPGAYLMLPVLGPSDARDVTSYPVGYYTNMLTYLALDTLTYGGFTALRIVNTRAQLEKAVQIRKQAALDPYAFTRSAYTQRRQNQVYDGHPPQQEDPYGDFFKNLDEGGGDDSGQ